jgi:hypothetical protein
MPLEIHKTPYHSLSSREWPVTSDKSSLILAQPFVVLRLTRPDYSPQEDASSRIAQAEDNYAFHQATSRHLRVLVSALDVAKRVLGQQSNSTETAADNASRWLSAHDYPPQLLDIVCR